MRAGTSDRSLNVAVIGAGPAGFYTAEALLKAQGVKCLVDIFERLPTPFGLVRNGVAPDHQKIKSVTRVYDGIARIPGFRYFGNVTFGTNVTREDLLRLYDFVVYAVGASSDRRMAIPGEDFAGSIAANAFTGWYNGQPDFADLAVDLSGERVVVVGNGNVAVDVARILLTSADDLSRTDISDVALKALRGSKIKEVVLLGRRGPEQAAFAPYELRELGNLRGVDLVVEPKDLEAAPSDGPSDANVRRNLEALRELSRRPSTDASRRLVFRFRISPVRLLGANSRVSGVLLEHNVLKNENGTWRARGTGVFETLATNLVIRSVGYRGIPLPGVPFDEQTGTIPNQNGRMCTVEGVPAGREYVVGWAKRGANGLIGTNRADAQSTVAAMLEDVRSFDALAPPDGTIEQILQERGAKYITYEQWQRLDFLETSLGRAQGRPRAKITSIDEMLSLLNLD